MNKNIRMLMGATAMLALSASMTLAESNKDTNKAKKTTNNGVVVTVDPQTHEVRQATPEEIGALDKSAPAPQNRLRTSAASAARQETKEVHHSTGAVGMTLDESYMTSMTVTKDAKGKLQYQCVEGKKDGGSHAR